MAEVLLQETSPYGTRRASLLRGDGDVYLYLEDLVGPEPETVSAVWVANHRPAPADPIVEVGDTAPPRMGAGGTRHPDGCPPLGPQPSLVWFEEGDAVAVVDGDGALAVIPGWAGRDGFYGYARHARGRSHLAWELTGQARAMLDQKVVESRDYWSWRRQESWSEVRHSGTSHLERRLGRQDAAWPIGDSTFPELIATRHQIEGERIWVTATTGLSAQRMAGVEQYLDVTDGATRIELAIARPEPDEAGAEVVGALATIPFGRCTWLGEGHTIGGVPGAYPAFGPDRAAALLTADPPPAGDRPAPDLRGLVRRGETVTYLWVVLVDEETFRIARGRDARAATAQARSQGVTWIQ